MFIYSLKFAVIPAIINSYYYYNYYYYYCNLWCVTCNLQPATCKLHPPHGSLVFAILQLSSAIHWDHLLSYGNNAWGDSSEIKVTDEFFWNFPWMIFSKHCFEKYNKNDRSPFLFKRCDGPLLPHFMPVLVLIKCIIHPSTLHFAVDRNIVYKRNTREKTWQVESVKHIEQCHMKSVENSHTV